MPSANQIDYVSQVKHLLAEPILIVGAKTYDFDEDSFLPHLRSWGFEDITGIDLAAGPGVDQVVDICEEHSEFAKKAHGSFGTVICMQVLYSTTNPFMAAHNIQQLLAPNGCLIFSDVFSHRIHRIPKDYWRFTYDAHKVLFKSLIFDDAAARVCVTRSRLMLPLQYPFPEVLQHSRHHNETKTGFFLRRVHRKVFATGIFCVSRFLPELSIFSCARKNGETALGGYNLPATN